MNKYSKLFNLNMTPNEASFILFSTGQKIPKENDEEKQLLISAYKKVMPEIIRKNFYKNKGYLTQ